jgi:hypothetical protein
MKKRQMIFEVGNLRVTVPLDPTEGRQYVESSRGKELDNIYSMNMWKYDYINPIVEDVQRLHEVSTRRCACITHTLAWIGDEVCDPPKYDGLTDVDIFVK